MLHGDLCYYFATLFREHYQWNMDIWGVPGVEAEAEVLSALVSSLQALGLTAQDVGIRVSSIVDMCMTERKSCNLSLNNYVVMSSI